MENKARTLTKAISWQAIGFVMMAIVNYFYMGNFSQGLGLSALLTLIGLLSYYLHERVWAGVRWGAQPAANTQASASDRLSAAATTG